MSTRQGLFGAVRVQREGKDKGWLYGDGGDAVRIVVDGTNEQLRYPNEAAFLAAGWEIDPTAIEPVKGG